MNRKAAFYCCQMRLLASCKSHLFAVSICTAGERIKKSEEKGLCDRQSRFEQTNKRVCEFIITRKEAAKWPAPMFSFWRKGRGSALPVPTRVTGDGNNSNRRLLKEILSPKKNALSGNFLGQCLSISKSSENEIFSSSHNERNGRQNA